MFCRLHKRDHHDDHQHNFEIFLCPLFHFFKTILQHHLFSAHVTSVILKRAFHTYSVQIKPAAPKHFWKGQRILAWIVFPAVMGSWARYYNVYGWLDTKVNGTNQPLRQMLHRRRSVGLYLLQFVTTAVRGCRSKSEDTYLTYLCQEKTGISDTSVNFVDEDSVEK